MKLLRIPVTFSIQQGDYLRLVEIACFEGNIPEEKEESPTEVMKIIIDLFMRFYESDNVNASSD